MVKKGIAVLTPEDLDDLWSIRRIIEPKDLISGKTTRLLKRESEYGRPDRGERIPVFLAIEVEEARLDYSLSRLRVTGKMVESSHEALVKGSYHSMVISPGYTFNLRKGKDEFHELTIRILRQGGREEAFLVVSLDHREGSVGKVLGTHLQIYPALSSGYQGKSYEGRAYDAQSFFEKLKELVVSSHREGSRIFITGPGIVKYRFSNYLAQNTDLGPLTKVLDGLDLSGEDGVRQSLRHPALKEFLEGTSLALAQSYLEELLRRIGRDDPRIAIGPKEVMNASKAKAIEAVLLSDRLFTSGFSEDALVNLLNEVDSYRGKSFLLDSSTDLGTQVSSLGGVIAILRFAIQFS